MHKLKKAQINKVGTYIIKKVVLQETYFFAGKNSWKTIKIKLMKNEGLKPSVKDFYLALTKEVCDDLKEKKKMEHTIIFHI